MYLGIVKNCRINISQSHHVSLRNYETIMVRMIETSFDHAEWIRVRVREILSLFSGFPFINRGRMFHDTSKPTKKSKNLARVYAYPLSVIKTQAVLPYVKSTNEFNSLI